jgi:hypothetical protein
VTTTTKKKVGPSTRAAFITFCKQYNAATRQQNRLWVLLVRSPIGVPVNAEERAKQRAGRGFKAGRGAPIGVAVCYQRGPNIFFGLSLCNPKEHKFNGHMGLYYALQDPACILRSSLETAAGEEGKLCEIVRAALADRAQLRDQRISSPRAEVAKTTVVHMLTELCNNGFKQLQDAPAAEGTTSAANDATAEALADEAAAAALTDEVADYPGGSIQP